MNGMVLAAGWGERMEPLSSVVPKPALEVLGRPLLAGAVSHLSAAGCERIVVNVHRHPDRVAAAVRSAVPGPLSFSWEPELLGSAGGISAARPLLGDGPVLVGNADTWGKVELQALLASADHEHLTMALLPHPDPGRWSSVVLDDDGYVEAFLPPGAAGPGRAYLYSGFQLLGRRVVASLPEPPADMTAVWDRLRRRRGLRGVVVEGTWREAGTPHAYLALVLEALAGEAWVHPQAEASGRATVVRSAVGAGCRVGAGSCVFDSVLTAGAAVDEGCELRGCVVAGSVTVRGVGSVSEALFLPSGRFPLRPPLTASPRATDSTPSSTASP